MSDGSEGKNEEEKTLSELKEKRSKKGSELGDVKEEIAKIEGEIAERKEKRKTKLKSFESERIFDHEKEIIIEETGTPEEITDYYFYSNEDGELKIIDHEKLKYFSRRGGKKFLEEEVEPEEVHDHGFGMEHRVWKLTGMECFVLRLLFNDGELGRIYAERGWRGLREYLDGIRKELSSPFLAELELQKQKSYRGRSSPLAHLIRGLDIPSIVKEAAEHALEKDLKIEESITSLTLEDEDFARRYKESERKIQSLSERWEKVLDHYGPDEDGD